MKLIYLLFLLSFTTCAYAQSADEKIIRELLARQTLAWNRGDLEGFMNGYWESDSLMFVGKNGIRYGWQATLNGYKKGYPDTTAMGKLEFTLLDLRQLSQEYFHVIGKWHLHRTIGDLEGAFTILLQKINGKWVIIADHSS